MDFETLHSKMEHKGRLKYKFDPMDFETAVIGWSAEGIEGINLILWILKRGFF